MQVTFQKRRLNDVVGLKILSTQQVARVSVKTMAKLDEQRRKLVYAAHYP